jgi:hypothetical protein
MFYLVYVGDPYRQPNHYHPLRPFFPRTGSSDSASACPVSRMCVNSFVRLSKGDLHTLQTYKYVNTAGQL